jgi:hypothetical protein
MVSFGHGGGSLANRHEIDPQELQRCKYAGRV